MTNVKKELVIELLRKDSAKNPKNAPTNDLVAEMLENCNIENLGVSPTRSGALYNRGEIVEIVVKSMIFEYCGLDFENINKALQKEHDLITSKIDVELLQDLGLPKSANIEIKFTSSIANASVKNNKARYCLIVNACSKYGLGAYLVESKKLEKDNHDHIKPSSVLNGVLLELLSELLGLY